MLLDGTAAGGYSSAQNRERVDAEAAFTATLMKRILSIDSWVMSAFMLIHTVHSHIDTHTDAHSQTDAARAHLQSNICSFPVGECQVSVMNSARMLVNPR